MGAKRDQTGRSMVEMLGVLAIVGILSIGAIAGYNKAMMKYRLNKQAGQIAQLVNTVNRYRYELIFNKFVNLVPYFKKLGEIPQDMYIPGNENEVRDVFNNKFYIYTNINTTEKTAVSKTVIYYYLDLSDASSIDVCFNLFQTIRETQNGLEYMAIGGNNSGETTKFKHYVGDNYCQSGRVCLGKATLEQIYDMCSAAYGKEQTLIHIVWRND